MKKALPILIFALSASGFAFQTSLAERLFPADGNLRAVFFERESSKAPDEETVVPFLPGEGAYVEDSEPDDFLDEASSLDNAENLSEEALQMVPETLFVDMKKAALPLESGRITSPYGFRHYRIHKGIDIGLVRGDTIRAAFAGKVSRVRYERRGYGKYIVLEHAENGITRTVYAHLSKQIVKVGDTVNAGDVIGLGGNTGRSTGPHLHFEMRTGDMPLDPQLFFDFRNHATVGEEIRLSRQIVESDYAALQKEASKHRYHKIRPGDTLGKIARKYHTSVKRLCALNGIKRNSVLRVGRILRCS